MWYLTCVAELLTAWDKIVVDLHSSICRYFLCTTGTTVLLDADRRPLPKVLMPRDKLSLIPVQPRVRRSFQVFTRIVSICASYTRISAVE